MNLYPEKFLTYREAAKYCSVSYLRMRTAVQNGEVEFFDLSPPGAKKSKGIRFTTDALDRWLKSLKRAEQNQTQVIL